MRYVPVVVSIAALVVAAAALLRGAPVQPERKDVVTRAEYDQVVQEVRMLRGALAQRYAAAVVTPTAPTAPPAAAPSGDNADSAASPPPAPSYVHFEAPHGVVIESKDNGAIAVRNNDASMTGKTVVVQAERADGTREPMTITIPAPER